MKKKRASRQGATKKADRQQTPRNSSGTCLSTSPSFLLALGLLIGGGFLLYANTLNAPFVFDDSIGFRDNADVHITSLSQLFDILLGKGLVRSFGYMTFAVNFYLDGLNPFGYHLSNVIIHLLNAAILFLVVFKTLTLPTFGGQYKAHAAKIALLGSLLWMVHPVQTMAVSYVVQRFTSLSALFFLLSLLGYILGRTQHSKKRWLWFGLCAATGVLAFGTKQNTALLPVIMLLYEFYFFMDLRLKGNERRLSLGLGTAAFLIAILAALYLKTDVVNTLSQRFIEREWSPYLRMITEMRVIVLYIGLLIYPNPSRLNVDYDFPLSSGIFSPPSTFFSLMILSGLFCLSIYLAKRNRLLSFCILWFFLNLIIESTVIPLDLVFEHRLYLPGMGPLMLFAGCILSLKPHVLKKAGVALTAVLVLLFSYWTYTRNLVWQDPVRLWEDTIKKSPNKARVHGNLGKAYLDRGEYEKARAAFEKTLEIDPTALGAYDNLATIYINHFKQYDRAREFLYEAIHRNPDYPSPYLNLGVINLRLRQLPEAVENFTKVLDLDPKSLLGHFNLAAAYFNLRDYERAVSTLERGISIWPASSKLYGLLGLIYFERKEWDLAENALEKALLLNPANTMAAEYVNKLRGSPQNE